MKVGDIVELTRMTGFLPVGQRGRVNSEEDQSGLLTLQTFTSDGRTSGTGAVWADSVKVVDCPETRRLAELSDKYDERLRAEMDQLGKSIADARMRAAALTATELCRSENEVIEIVDAFERHYRNPRP